ncbi:Tetratricopeptide repeat-containing protein [Amycolatopsis pretoriensis]|uniref:Tetratricopeptide repeat-containing protein n=1 Tax=Amycolatopsis pretoriensis TaxID=218821 RepID=A0A1H5QKZ9_9PSEU|nr:FxSxx-COOH system tetratricopeptide repeat protein [Amycolatopsis pretoriensis]SEF26739.1 Tetratricopeptide repeat-containing protein [Amycolatopsis pretoriensis]
MTGSAGDVPDAEALVPRDIADDLCPPVLRGGHVGQDSVLDVAVVVPDAPSMVLWQPVVARFVELITASNVFRAVRRWRLTNTEAEPSGGGAAGQLVLRGEGEDSPARQPAELLEHPDPQVVLVVTDGLGDMWSRDLVSPVLAGWAGSTPTAILQLLPTRLWNIRGPELHQAILASDEPLEANRHYRLNLVDAWIEPTGFAELAESAVPVPVLEFTRRGVRWWSEFICGGGGELPAKVFLARDESSRTSEGLSVGQVDLTAHDRVTRFRSVASRSAFRLATLLAAVPISVGVARVLQERMVPGGGLVELAELFGSGLFESSPGLSWDRAEWRCSIEVRERLLGGARRSETAEAIEVAYSHGVDVDPTLSRLRQAVAEPASALSGPAVDADESALQGAVLRALSGVAYVSTATMGLDTTSRRATLEGSPKVNAMIEASVPAGLDECTSPDDGVDDDDVRKKTQAQAAAAEIRRRHPRPDGEAPPVWGQIPPRNANFTGRGELLARLVRQLTYGATAVLPAALHGMGGIGKTQIAVEYIYRYKQIYDIIWWVQATRPTQIRKSLTELAQRLKLPDTEESLTAVPAVLEALRVGAPYNRWLLVFDSAEDPDVVRQFFPSGMPDNVRGDILVTSRNPSWAGDAQPLGVAVFDRTESKQLLSARGSALDDAAADRISSKLGDLPLAVEQAAAWLAETGMPASQYLELFDSKVAELLNTPAPRDYQVSVGAAWNVSLDELRKKNPAADQLLQVCAYFAPEPIARSLFTVVQKIDVTPELNAALHDPIQLGRVVRDVSRYGLAKIDHRADTLLVHRLVQLVLRSRMDEERRGQMRSAAHQLLANLDPNAPTSPREWPRYQQIVPHIYDAELVKTTEPVVRKLVVNLLSYLYHWGDHQEALTLAESAVAEWRRNRFERLDRGEELPEQDLLLELLAAERLAFFQWVVGRYAHAEVTIRETLEAYLESIGPRREETLDAQVTYALILKSRGDFAGARALNEQILAEATGLLGRDDPISLAAAHDCVVSRLLTGDYKAARELAEETFERRSRILGHDNVNTIATQVLLVIARRELGDYSWARIEQEQITKRAESFYGNDRVGTLRRKHHQAVACRKDGDHVRARSLSSDANKRFEARYGDRHPNALACALGHSIDLRHAQLFDQAKDLGEKVLARYRESLGEKHPHTLAAAVDLGVTLRLSGSPADALKMDETALELLEEILGADHPHTIVCAINVASDLFALERTQESAAKDARLVERATGVLGRNHPTTLAVRLNYSLDLREVRRFEEADELFADVMHGYRQKLGDTHPGTLAASRGVRADCDIDPMPL